MPLILFVWLLLPIAFDVRLTVLISHSLSLPGWAVFGVPMAAGAILIATEWQRVRFQWAALKRLQGSPLSLLGSARRGLAGVLLVIPGFLSDLVAVLLLISGFTRRRRPASSATFYSYTAYRGAGRTTPENSREPKVIEGEYRKD